MTGGQMPIWDRIYATGGYIHITVSTDVNSFIDSGGADLLVWNTYFSCYFTKNETDPKMF